MQEIRFNPMGCYSRAYMQSENFTLGLIRGGGGLIPGWGINLGCTVVQH